MANTAHRRHAQRLTRSEKERVFSMLKQMDKSTNLSYCKEARPTLVHENDFPTTTTSQPLTLPLASGDPFVVIVEEGEATVSQSHPPINRLPAEFYEYFEVVGYGNLSPDEPSNVVQFA